VRVPASSRESKQEEHFFVQNPAKKGGEKSCNLRGYEVRNRSGGGRTCLSSVSVCWKAALQGSTGNLVPCTTLNGEGEKKLAQERKGGKDEAKIGQGKGREKKQGRKA